MKKRKQPETSDSSSEDTDASSSESEMDFYSSESSVKIQDSDSSVVEPIVKCNKVKQKKKISKKCKAEETESDSNTMDIESLSSGSTRKKKLFTKKAKATKTPEEQENVEMDINKFRIITGRGRVSVPCDQWIQLMEFVQ